MMTDYFYELLQSLIVSPAVVTFEIKRMKVVEDEGFLRVRCVLPDHGILEFSEYLRENRGRYEKLSYSYHWQAADGALIKRWDNVPHYPALDSFPHHLHLWNGEVTVSQETSLEDILQEIQETLKA